MMENIKLKEKLDMDWGMRQSSMFWKLFTMYLCFFIRMCWFICGCSGDDVSCNTYLGYISRSIYWSLMR